MPNFLKRMHEGHWVTLGLVAARVALVVAFNHEANDPVRKAGLAKCAAFCGEHPVRHLVVTENGTLQCDCEAFTRGVAH